VTTSDVVETVTFETEIETCLKFQDETETETETSSKTPRPRLETWSSRLQICAFCQNFSKKCCHYFWPWASAGGETGISLPWDWNL